MQLQRFLLLALIVCLPCLCRADIIVSVGAQPTNVSFAFLSSGTNVAAIAEAPGIFHATESALAVESGEFIVVLGFANGAKAVCKGDNHRSYYFTAEYSAAQLLQIDAVCDEDQVCICRQVASVTSSLPGLH